MMTTVDKQVTAYFKEERQQVIQRLIEDELKVNVDDLADRFNVSNVTIRRDLNELEKKGFVERTHGGAISHAIPRKHIEPELLDRVNVCSEEKKALAKYVASIVKSGETIYLSAGSTMHYIAQELIHHIELTVVTNSLIIATTLAKAPGIRVIMLGGILRKDEMALSYVFTENTIKSIHFDRVFIGCRGIHPRYGVTNDNDPTIVGSDGGILDVYHQGIVVADHTKIGFSGNRIVAPIEHVDTLITTSLASDYIVSAIQECGIKVERINI